VWCYLINQGNYTRENIIDKGPNKGYHRTVPKGENCEQLKLREHIRIKEN
jgi:hypothetical protein